MSDQRNPNHDQDPTGTPSKSVRLWADLDRKPGLFDQRSALVLLVLVSAACVSATGAVIAEPPLLAAAAVERWVDASAPEGGDGTPRRAFKRLNDALAPNAVIHLRSGLYPGPWVLPPGSALVGHGEVVLYAEGEGTVVTASSASLEGLWVQGGFIGLRAIGPVSVRRVHFSGSRRVALEASGILTLEDSLLEGTVSQTVGVQLTRGARARLGRVRFLGAFARAVDAQGAQLDGEDLQSEGPAQALHLENSRSQVRRLTAAGGSGPGIFVAEGALTLTDATVNGHEFGLQARKAALTLVRFTSRRVQLASIATVQCTGTFSDIQTEQSGTYGALQLLESDLKVKGVKVQHARAIGILVRLGKVKLEDVTVDHIRAEGGSSESGGDGLELRDAEVEVDNLIIRDAAGIGIFATAGARVEVNRFSCERCRVGAVVCELGSTVSLKSMISKGGEGPAIAVLDRASVKLEDADITAVQVPIWAECDQGARVTVTRLKSNLVLPPSGCIWRD